VLHRELDASLLKFALLDAQPGLDHLGGGHGLAGSAVALLARLRHVPLGDPLVEVFGQVVHVGRHGLDGAPLAGGACHAVQLRNTFVSELVLRTGGPADFGHFVDFVGHQVVVLEGAAQVQERDRVVVHSLQRLVQVVVQIYFRLDGVEFLLELHLFGVGVRQQVLDFGVQGVVCVGFVQVFEVNSLQVLCVALVCTHLLLESGLGVEVVVFVGVRVAALALDDFLHLDGLRVCSAGNLLVEFVGREFDALLTAPVAQVFVVLPARDRLPAVGLVFFPVVEFLGGHALLLGAVRHVDRLELAEAEELVAVHAHLEAFVLDHGPHELLGVPLGYRVVAGVLEGRVEEVD